MRLTVTLLILIPLFTLSALGQQQTGAIYKADTRKCAEIRVIGQKEIKNKKRNTPPDLIIVRDDDVDVELQLTNICDSEIYYLSTDDYQEPFGYFIYRRKGQQWQARSPSWRRERAFVSSIYRWRPLGARQNIRFKFSDLRLIKGDRSVALYISYNPTTAQEEIIEVLAAPFVSSVLKPHA
jgi:hypothetical protein